jgi:hypothetical protein
MENSLNLSITAYGWDWLTRWIVLVLAAGCLVTIAVVIRDQQRQRAKPSGAPQALDTEADKPLVSLPFAILVCLAFAYALIDSIGWPYSVRLFPQWICAPALLLALFVLYRDVQAARPVLAQHGGLGAASRPGAWLSVSTRRLLAFYLWLVAIIVATLVIGQIAALTLFIAAYLYYWGGYRQRSKLWIPAVYAAGGALFLYVVFDRIVHINWHPSLLFG